MRDRLVGLPIPVKMVLGFLCIPVILVGAVIFLPASLGAMVWSAITGDDSPMKWLDKLV